MSLDVLLRRRIDYCCLFGGHAKIHTWVQAGKVVRMIPNEAPVLRLKQDVARHLASTSQVARYITTMLIVGLNPNENRTRLSNQNFAAVRLHFIYTQQT